MIYNRRTGLCLLKWCPRSFATPECVDKVYKSNKPDEIDDSRLCKLLWGKNNFLLYSLPASQDALKLIYRFPFLIDKNKNKGLTRWTMEILSLLKDETLKCGLKCAKSLTLFINSKLSLLEWLIEKKWRKKDCQCWHVLEGAGNNWNFFFINCLFNYN